MALKMTYNVDMCFCIDATGSMGPVINTVKQNALSFYKDVVAVMEKKQKTINSMRVKVIIFRDYVADEEPMLMTKFFQLPQEAAKRVVAVALVIIIGGGILNYFVNKRNRC